MTSATEFEEAYAAAFARYLASPGEDALAAAYDLGRSAVKQRLGVLDLASVHHDTLAAHAEAGDAALPAMVRAGGEFFLEALSAFEMVQRVLREAREAAAVERRQAVVMRRLSGFLADASIALDASRSLGEILQLVAEHAREVLHADGCVARLTTDDATLAEASAGGDTRPAQSRLAAPLTALDGRASGRIEVFAARPGEFSGLDEAILVQLAQMASAAVERAQLYRH